jgi:16S rRNA (cytidine1402-2'-O)-methyltransferase
MRRQKSFINDSPTLYLVTTPIGNLEDITLRAINTLKKVDKIYCEDTRVSVKLLKHYEIEKPLDTYHDHNKDIKKEHILNDLSNHKSVALISDAGHPLISDPGYTIVKEAKEKNFNVVSIPGASALLTAISVSEIAPHPFLFYGFLPPKQSARKKTLEHLKTNPETLIFYESPHRIHKTISDCLEVFGNRIAVIARELTKKYEEIIHGSLEELLEVEDIKGEMVLIIEGYQKTIIENDQTILEDINELINLGVSSKEAIKAVAKRRNLPKNEVYMTYHQK